MSPEKTIATIVPAERPEVWLSWFVFSGWPGGVEATGSTCVVIEGSVKLYKSWPESRRVGTGW